MFDYFGKLNKNVIDQIQYRGTMVTGEITKDNEDGTYAVKIAQAEVAHPYVETAFPGMVFAIGEVVLVTFEYGIKEMPRILGYAKRIVQHPIDVESDYSGEGGDPITTVATLNAYSITEITAYLEGRISLSEGTGNCTRRGFKYGLTTDYGSDVHEDGDYGEGAFALQISGLVAEETYHFQAYVIDVNDNEQVGEDKTLTTPLSVLIPKIFVYNYHTVDGYCIKSYDIDGNYVNTFPVDEIYEYAAWNSICVDGNDNIYYVDKDATNYYIYKYDKDGNQLLKEIIQIVGQGSLISICIGNDGYIYSLEINGSWGGSGRWLVKRSSSNLSLINKLDKGGELHKGITCDSNGYLYIVNTSDDEIEKWTMGGKVAFHSVSVTYGFNLAWAGSLVGGVAAVTIFTFPLALNEAQDNWSLVTFWPVCICSLGNDFVAGGGGKIVKYKTDKTKVWETVMSGSSIYQIAAYPF